MFPETNTFPLNGTYCAFLHLPLYILLQWLTLVVNMAKVLIIIIVMKSAYVQVIPISQKLRLQTALTAYFRQFTDLTSV